MEIRVASSLEKIFCDGKGFDGSFREISALLGEEISFQVAYRKNDEDGAYVNLKVDCALPVQLYTVGNVPVETPIRPERCDADYLRREPGIYPDVLEPYNGKTLFAGINWHAIWVSIDIPEDTAPGCYPVKISLDEKTVGGYVTVNLKVIGKVLPKQTLKVTQWFHTDCIAQYYGVKVFSERYWELVEQFASVAAHHGQNMILTPVVTPPLDTEIGGERLTVQLVDITKNTDGSYSFDFSNLKRWIEIFSRQGFKYFEVCHLFTQWGAFHAPKIMAWVNGKNTRIFGWETDSLSAEYTDFVTIFLKSLVDFFRKQNMEKQVFFHVSDEPQLENLDRYRIIHNLVRSAIGELPIIEACSNLEIYEGDENDIPIPSTSSIRPFIDAKLPQLWCYYCGGQTVDVSNRFIAMPSYRNRIIGVQMYKYNVEGFLHWGYNYYNSSLSMFEINPYRVTDACRFLSGDSFSVYPGKDGAIPSLRLKVFSEALNDLRALKLLESKIGRDAVMQLVECEGEITFSNYPRHADYLLNLRKKVNQLLQCN